MKITENIDLLHGIQLGFRGSVILYRYEFLLCIMTCVCFIDRFASGIPDGAGSNTRHSRRASPARVPSAQGSSGGPGRLAEERQCHRFTPGISFRKVSS